MLAFAEDTGLNPPTQNPRRYLWTDAFAVCQFLALFNSTKDVTYRDLAVKLVDQVHNTLGKYRQDDSRKGHWLSNLSEEEAIKHPTIAGLRIGKKLPERDPSESYDDDLEWDRDGQYFHYITKWMHALLRIGKCTGDNKYINQAAELIIGTHSKFTYNHKGILRMYWKMSCDLSRYQVPSMGHHDPLDGFLTYSDVFYQLQDKELQRKLEVPIKDLETICLNKDWTTNDPLGLGGLLCDCLRLFKLYKISKEEKYLRLLRALLEDTDRGMLSYSKKKSIGCFCKI